MMTADGNGERSSAEARVSAVVKESWVAKLEDKSPAGYSKRDNGLNCCI